MLYCAACKLPMRELNKEGLCYDCNKVAEELTAHSTGAHKAKADLLCPMCRMDYVFSRVEYNA